MKDIISRVAAMHGIPAEEARADMQDAINAAGFDVEPELFLQIMTAQILERQKENPAN